MGARVARIIVVSWTSLRSNSTAAGRIILLFQSQLLANCIFADDELSNLAEVRLLFQFRRSQAAMC